MPYRLPSRLDKKCAISLIEKVDNFLFDCDGVIWNYPNAIAGSIETINKLKEMGKRCFFITNNSTKTRKTVMQIIEKFGIKNVSENEIVCTSWVLAGYLQSINFKDKVYMIGNPAMGTELDNLNIKHTGIGPNSTEFPDPSAFDYKSNLKLDPDVKAVAVGFDHHFNYPKIVLATTYAHKVDDCLFICTNDDAILPTGKESSAVIPGTGTIVNSVRTSIKNRKAVMLGKPNKTMWDVLVATHGLNPERSCMIGDRLDTDIAFAANCSLGFSLAVLSGVTNVAEINVYAEKINSKNGNYEDEAKLCPDFYVECLGEFGKLIDNC